MWFDDEGMLGLHPVDADIILKRTKEIAASSGPGIAMCIDMLDNWQHDLASSMTSESELPFREHVKESLKKSADCWQWTRSEKIPWKKQKRVQHQQEEYKGRVAKKWTSTRKSATITRSAIRHALARKTEALASFATSSRTMKRRNNG